MLPIILITCFVIVTVAIVRSYEMCCASLDPAHGSVKMFILLDEKRRSSASRIKGKRDEM